MVPNIPPVGITQNERFLSCNTLLLWVRYDKVICITLTFVYVIDTIVMTTAFLITFDYTSTPAIYKSVMGKSLSLSQRL
jgi:hypothetical protein